MGQLHVAMLHDKVMHAKVHVPGAGTAQLPECACYSGSELRVVY